MLPGTRSTAALAALLLTGAALARGGPARGGQPEPLRHPLAPPRLRDRARGDAPRRGAINYAAPRRLGPACVGLVTVEPNYIVRTTARLPLLRFHVRSPGDTALVVNTPLMAAGAATTTAAAGTTPLVDAVTRSRGSTTSGWAAGAAGAPLRATLTVTERAESPDRGADGPKRVVDTREAPRVPFAPLHVMYRSMRCALALVSAAPVSCRGLRAGARRGARARPDLHALRARAHRRRDRLGRRGEHLQLPPDRGVPLPAALGDDRARSGQRPGVGHGGWCSSTAWATTWRTRTT